MTDQALRDLPLDGQGPAYGQIYRAIRAAIRRGRVEAGLRLPSTRWLAADLGVSRNTVIAAYDQLLAEGYAESRVGAGTFVASQLSSDRIGAPRRTDRRDPTPPRLSRYGARVAADRSRRVYDAIGTRKLDVDFMPCVPGVRASSNEAWARCVTRQLARADADSHQYADPSGDPSLREEVARYLRRSRGVDCDAEDIAIVSGAAQALDLCARLLLDEGDRALLEEPHYVGAQRAFEAVGARLVAAPVDRDGADLEAVPEAELERCRLAYVTPSHQFPLGSVMSLSRRMALLDWAQRCDAYVIEDDYDSEFRYAGRAIESLKSLDSADRVIYVGTFSKVLDPALRLGYLVLPPALRSVFRGGKWLADWASPTFEQQALARFIADGEFERHLRRMRTLYGRKRAVLLDALSKELEPESSIFDSRTGLHVMVDLPQLPTAVTEELMSRCLKDSVGIYSAAPYYLRPPGHAQLVLGFTLPTVEAIPVGAQVIAERLQELV
jgi:GntR family transcriptional regulator/MocR family aminotransferase